MRILTSRINPCNFCNGIEWNLLFHAKDYFTSNRFKLYKCTRCDLIQTEPKPNKLVLTSYYNNYRREGGTRFPEFIEQWLNLGYLLKVKRILKFFSKGYILDVGCGRGLELKLLKQKGWKVLGTEISKDLLIQLSNLNIPVVNSDISEIKGKKKFDVITFFHSLEHLYYPNKALKATARLIKKNGYLIIAVPNFGSFENIIFKGNGFHLDVPRHLFHFYKTTLVNFMEKLGFKLQNCKNFSLEYDLYSFVQGGLNTLIPQSDNTLYRFLLGEKFSISKILNLFIQLPVALLLFLISLIIVPIFASLGWGGTMVLTFKKVKE